MKKLINSILIILCILALPSCNDEKDRAGGDGIHQMATLYNVNGDVVSEANLYRATSIALEEEDESIEKSVAVGVNRPVDADEKVVFTVSDEAANMFNQVNGNKYQKFPVELVTLPEDVVIKKGEMMSSEGQVRFNVSDQIKPGVPYVVALSVKELKNDKGGCHEAPYMLMNTKTIVYTIIKPIVLEDQITKAVHLYRTNYFSVAQTMPTSRNGMTLETFVNVQQFRNDSDPGDAQISTLFGIEGSCLFRFGDAGVPGNHLQCCGQKMDFKFETNKWYHIAAVFSADGNLTMYVNGEKKVTIPGKYPNVSSYDWFIGKSYNSNRGINALLSEFKIWNRALSADEINEGMFGVDPTNPDLLAYWKMDKAKGFEVEDITGHGYNLRLNVQKQNASTPTEANRPADMSVSVELLENPVEIDE